MRLSRKEFLKLGLAAGAGLVLPFGVTACGGSTNPLLESAAPLPEPFSVPLQIPPVLEPVRSDGSANYYDITTRKGDAEILPGLNTEVWGYNGIFPGPTIRSRSGRKVVIRTRNELPVPIVTHLHGGQTPPESDGYPTDLILPAGGWSGPVHGGGRISNGTFDYEYPLDQRAATLWYHDHRMDFTGPQVWRGLAGFHLVHDDEEDALPLPRDERDVPLMIVDRTFAQDGSMSYPSIDPQLYDQPGVTGAAHNGILGDVILVNGMPWPFFEVEAARYRLRLLNASNARRYRLTLDPEPSEGPSFVQIGSDGGLLDTPRDLDSIYIVPAERFDVVIDFSRYSPGTSVVLGNRLGDGAARQVMQFRVTRSARDDSTIPTTLAYFERLDPSRAVRTRDFSFDSVQEDGHTMYRVNDRAFEPDFIAADPELGSTEIWSLRSNTHHPVHLHLSSFQVLERVGSSGLQPEDAGWKDTIRLQPNEEAKILVRFEGYTGKYVFHCHNLEHEDMAMMANFEVV